MPRPCRTCSCTTPTVDSPTFHPGASLLRLVVLLWIGGACAFSAAPARPAGATTEFFQHTLVESTDQLEQQQQPRNHGNECSGPVPPPHLFRIAAPGGDICLVVDEKKSYFAMRDRFPPFGLPVSQTGVVDSQVRVVSGLAGTCIGREVDASSDLRDWCSVFYLGIIDVPIGFGDNGPRARR